MAKKIDRFTFEQSLEELQEVVKMLESGELSLDKSIELYRKGMDLAKQCHTKLEDAEQKVQQVVRENGNYHIETFEVKDGDE